LTDPAGLESSGAQSTFTTPLAELGDDSAQDGQTDLREAEDHDDSRDDHGVLKPVISYAPDQTDVME